MQIVNIERRTITLEMHPEESIILQQALEHALFHELFEEKGVLIEAMATAFGALALAGASYSVMQISRGDTFTYLDMRDGKLLDPGYIAVADA